MNKIFSTALLLLVNLMLFSQGNIKEQPFYFVQITDPQFGFIDENKGFEKETELYSRAIEKINKLSPAFVVITGDLVNDSRDLAQINEFKRVTGLFRSDIPVYLSPGNHDLGQDARKDDMKFYFSHYGKGSDRFSFEYGNSTFIGFNSVIIKSKICKKAERRQFRWLKRQLRKAQDSENIILFTHYPFFINEFYEKTGYSNQTIKTREKYFKLFGKYGVNAVFSGHLHNNVVSEYGNIQNIITSSVGKQLGDGKPGVRIVKVYHDRIEFEYFPSENIPETVEFN